MLIVPYYIAAITIAGVAALTASFTIVGKEIRIHGACNGISCGTCKHRVEKDQMASESCVKCITKGFGQGFERTEN